MNEKMKNIPWGKILGVTANIAAILALYYAARTDMFNSVGKIVDNKINDIEYIRKVASQVRPFFEFDMNGSIYDAGGGMQYIEGIKIEFDKDNKKPLGPTKVIITPKSYMENKPYIYCLSTVFFGIKSKRGQKYDWEFEFTFSGHTGPIDDIRYRVEIIP